MGALYLGDTGRPIGRDEDNCIKAYAIPAGFLKVTRHAINLFVKAYPELCYGEPCNPMIDLFNHGAHKGTWYGEDYAFARNWIEKCGDVWVIPDLQIDHYAGEVKYPGNYHEFLLKRPGGKNACPPQA